MDKPKTLNEAIQRLESVSEERDSLRSQVDQLNADLEASKALNDENQSQVNQLNSDITATRAENETLKNQNQDLTSKLTASEARAEDLQKQVRGEDRKAAEIAASVGVDPLAVTNTPAASAMNKEEFQEKLNSLKGAERQAFWRANRKQFYK